MTKEELSIQTHISGNMDIYTEMISRDNSCFFEICKDILYYEHKKIKSYSNFEELIYLYKVLKRQFYFKTK